MDPQDIAKALKEIRINSYWQLLILSTVLPGIVLMGELLFLIFGSATTIRDLNVAFHDLYWLTSLLLFIIFVAASLLFGLASRHFVLFFSRQFFNQIPERDKSWSDDTLSKLGRYFVPEKSQSVLEKYPFWRNDQLLDYVPFCRYWTEVNQPLFYQRIKRDELEINFHFALVPPLLGAVFVSLKLHQLGVLTIIWFWVVVAALVLTAGVIFYNTVKQRAGEELRILRLFVTAHLVTEVR